MQPKEADAALVVVYRSQGMLGAEAVKALLLSQGIPAILKYQSLARVLAVTVDGLGLVEVLVRPEDESAALELLQADAADDTRDEPTPEK